MKSVTLRVIMLVHSDDSVVAATTASSKSDIGRDRARRNSRSFSGCT
jgi:hypothetical protein